MEYVYFFRETNRPFVKIGRSCNDLSIRFNCFKTYAPLGAYIVGYIETDDSKKLELELHKKYSDRRLKGEFFNMTDDEVYLEINIYNKDFGLLVFKLKSFMDERKISVNTMYDLLLSKYEASIEKNNKYVPSELMEQLLKSKVGEKMTNFEIMNFLKDNGVQIEMYALGVTLREMGYKKKSARINGEVKRIYFL